MPAKKTTATKSKTSKTTPAKKAASPKKRAAGKPSKSKAGDQEVTIDRRRKADRRDEHAEEVATNPTVEKRAKVQRRRQIDPTTCERDYSEAEVEFMNAMDEYKRTSGRMFPTCSEVLEVIRDLGYVQLTPAEIAVIRPETNEESVETESVSDDYENAELEAEELAF